MANGKDHPKGGISIKIGYGVYNVFQQYWGGQGDLLYAVLSRRGHSVDWVEYKASKEEIKRLIEVAEEILAIKRGDPMHNKDTVMHKRVAKLLLKQLKPKLITFHHGKPQESLEEGERAIGAYYYNATAKHYHGVDNSDGALEGVGPMLENDSRLIERHIKRLINGRPIDSIVQDLLETGKNQKNLSPHERMLARLSKKSPLGVYKGKTR